MLPKQTLESMQPVSRLLKQLQVSPVFYDLVNIKKILFVQYISFFLQFLHILYDIIDRQNRPKRSPNFLPDVKGKLDGIINFSWEEFVDNLYTNKNYAQIKAQRIQHQLIKDIQ